MGYSASGSGSAILKDGCRDELKNTLEKNPEKFRYEEIDWDIVQMTINHKQVDYIDFTEYDSHWHDDDTEFFLNLLTPYITEGHADYNGEDGCIWRYKFYPDKNEWLEESGEITFESEFKCFEFNELEGDGTYKVKQIDEHLNAMNNDPYYIAQVTGPSAKPINLDRNALEILKAYYSGHKIRIKRLENI